MRSDAREHRSRRGRLLGGIARTEVCAPQCEALDQARIARRDPSALHAVRTHHLGIGEDAIERSERVRAPESRDQAASTAATEGELRPCAPRITRHPRHRRLSVLAEHAPKLRAKLRLRAVDVRCIEDQLVAATYVGGLDRVAGLVLMREVVTRMRRVRQVRRRAETSPHRGREGQPLPAPVRIVRPPRW